MASERVAAEQDHVHQQHERADVHVEVAVVPTEEAVPRVFGEQPDKDDRDVEEVAVDVLDDEGEGTFAEVSLARLADGTVRRIGPERFVVSAAVVVTREAKTAGSPQDQKR